MIRDLLKNKTAKEQARVIAEEISKLNHVGKFKDKDTEVEILSLEKIEINGQHGIEIMAKAWKGGKQLGFMDGSVEIERFRIWNPPIFVEDPNGDIVYTLKDREGIEHTYRDKEDLIEAVRISLAQIIKTVGKENTEVIKGKIGNTTSTFYSSVSPTSPLDGYTAREGDVVWATTRDGASGTTYNVDQASHSIGAGNYGTPTYQLYRSNNYFDTSTIGTDNVTSAVLSMRVRGTIYNENNGSLRLLDVTSSGTATLVAGDYNKTNYGTTGIGSDVAFSSLTTETFYDFPITTLTAINKTGITKIGAREVVFDIGDSAPANGIQNIVDHWTKDKATAGYLPYLTVVHAAAVATGNFFNFFGPQSQV